MNNTYRLIWNELTASWVAVSEITAARGKRTSGVLLLAAVSLLTPSAQAQTPPDANQLPVGGQVVAGQAGITQSGAVMTIHQSTDRAAINWQRFDIGSAAQVNFVQPSSSSVALNRVTDPNPSQIFGRLNANGQVFLTNASGVYFAPGATVNVGALVATTHGISDADFMAGRHQFSRDGATGAVVNEGEISAALGGYVALLAPEVRNQGVVMAQLGTVALAAGEMFELQFDGQGGLSDIRVSPASVATLLENRHAIVAPGGLVILSAQAASQLQGGVIRHSGSIEASGIVDDGGVVRLLASDRIEASGSIHADAAAGSSGNGGEVLVIATLDNLDSHTAFSGSISARGGDAGGDGGFVETSASHFSLGSTAQVDTRSPQGRTGDWLIDPYDYTIGAGEAATLVTALASTNVEVTTSAHVPTHGSNGNVNSTGDITVNSAINAAGGNRLTLTAANAINVNAAISTGALTLNGPGGISLGADLTTLYGMTLNGNVTLTNNVTLTSGVSNTYTTYTNYVVPVGVTSITATLVGGAGGKGGDDGGFQGGSTGAVGSLTASFAVNGGDNLYIAPGSGGGTGVSSQGNAAGGAGGTNQFSLASGGAGGIAGPTGSSGGGGGGGAATILALTSSPNSGSAMLVAAGGGGGGGSGNNSACPSLCQGQNSANYQAVGTLNGATGNNSGNQTPSINDGGASGGGGGGLRGGASNESIFFVNEWTGRGGNAGTSGAANGFSTSSLSTLAQPASNGQAGYAIISYGGGTVAINGTVNGGYGLNVLARSSDVSITGAVGGGTALTSLNITGAGGIDLGGGGVTTSGAQTYTGPVTLSANNTAMSSTGNGAITFAGDLVKGSGVNGNLSVSTGSGAVAFNGKVGSSSTPLGTLSVSTTGTTTLAGEVYAGAFSKSGSGTTAVTGGLVRTATGQSYGGVLDLGGDTQLDNTGAGNITLSGAVSNSTQSNLTIAAANGNVTLSGNLAVGTNARPTPIGDVSISASGTVTLGSSGTPISADARSLSVTANVANTHANSSTSFSCNGGANVAGLCFTASTSFDVAGASTFSGPLVGTSSFAKAGAGTLTMTGTNLYTGNTTVAGRLEIGGTGSLGGGNYAGNIHVTGQVRFASSTNQILTGTMSGSGFINSPGSGTINVTTLGSTEGYNLYTAYVVPMASGGGSSSVYGDAPNITYMLATTAGGGTAVTDAEPSGTAVVSGAPTAASNVGNYSVSYVSGLSLGNERYTLAAGNAVNWSVNPRPLTVTVSKAFDGNALFANGFTLSGMANGDAAPGLTGSASVASETAGVYSSFASSTLALDDTNYTLTNGTVAATILGEPPVVPVVTDPPLPPDGNTQPELVLPPATAPVVADATPPVGVDAGIVITEVRVPTLEASGMISVSVPRKLATAGSGFSFPLPAQLESGGNAAQNTLSVRTAEGGPLPGWLQFDPQTRTFTATAVPPGGLPIHVHVQQGDLSLTIVIFENPEES
ncbi:MAG: beta strand repeat-containing protein [Gammaproteobacteria bacterium]